MNETTGPVRLQRILALAHAPKEDGVIRHWRPFEGGRELGAIIDEVNSWAVDKWQKIVKHPTTKDLLRYYEIVSRDLSTCHDLTPKDFDDIFFILLDSNLPREDIANKKGCIQHSAAAAQARAAESDVLHIYHLPQVAQRADSTSKSDLFEEITILPSSPEIFTKEDSLEEYFRVAHRTLYAVARELVEHELVMTLHDKVIPSVPHVMARPEKWQPESKADWIWQLGRRIRDAAMRRKLSEDETRRLACRTMQLESHVLGIEVALEAALAPRIDVKVDSLRMGPEQIPLTASSPSEPVWFEPEIATLHVIEPWSAEIHSEDVVYALEKVDLIGVKTTMPIFKMSAQAQENIRNLGIWHDNECVVFKDNPKIEEKINLLGVAAETFHFSAELPNWSVMKA